jgi:hypothetical protein
MRQHLEHQSNDVGFDSFLTSSLANQYNLLSLVSDCACAYGRPGAKKGARCIGREGAFCQGM